MTRHMELMKVGKQSLSTVNIFSIIERASSRKKKEKRGKKNKKNFLLNEWEPI